MKNITKIIAVALIILSFGTTTVYASLDALLGGPVLAVPGNSEPTGQYGSVQAFAISVNGDVNADGKVDSLDAAQILKRDAGTITEFDNKEAEYTLTEEEELTVREIFWNEHIKGDGINDGIERAEVGRYFGEYNGWKVIRLTDTDRPLPEEVGWHYVYSLNGYIFYYEGSHIYAVKDDSIYVLWEAYENGILTDEDIRNIAIQDGTVPADIWVDAYKWEPNEDGTYPLVSNLFGDANNDRKVDSLDAAWILKYDAGLVE